MALTDKDREEIREVIHDAVMGSCLCGHKEDVIKLFDSFETLGSGNIAKGIKSFERSVSMMTRIRHLGERVGGETAVWLFRLFVLGLLGLIGWGIKGYIGKGAP